MAVNRFLGAGIARLGETGKTLRVTAGAVWLHTHPVSTPLMLFPSSGEHVIENMKIAYADPPYPGMSYFYKDHPDYEGEVDHVGLISHLQTYDGWCLHTASTTLKEVLALCPQGVRIMAWVKPFASWKKNVSVAYAWEPVIVKPCRIRKYDGLTTTRDWIAESITLERGLTGAKPESVCR